MVADRQGGVSKPYAWRHADLREAKQCPRACEPRDRAGREHRDKNDGVHDVGQRHHAGLAVHDYEGAGVGAAASKDVFVRRADVDCHYQAAHDVEQAQTDPDGRHGFRDRATGVLGLGCDEPGVLAACHGEDAGRHHAEEAFEAV